MKVLIAIILSIGCIKEGKECYLVKYQHNGINYCDTLILPINTFKNQDTVLYQPNIKLYAEK